MTKSIWSVSFHLIITAVLQGVVMDEVVEPPPPPPAAETLEVCKPEEESHPVPESTKVCLL